ncbi:hypothetical protein ACHAWO_013279 [Cyclotella atomus]|uniref:RING-type domain-containing protein n=1 Tax=Cyclotella atomus TaxID=382360 RepID=A0ABD3NU41_9STRA
MSSLLDIEMFWYASFQLGKLCLCFNNHELLIDHRHRSHTLKPDRTIRLSKENAKLLPEKIYDQSTTTTDTKAAPTCSICINDLKSGDVLKVLSPCQHTFHSKCIVQWLTEYKNCCPLCMKPVLVKH